MHQEKENRNFGLLFSLIFLLIFLYFFFKYNIFYASLLFVSVIMTLISFLKPNFLKYFTKLWILFGLTLSKVTTPLILGIIFFFLVTPIAILLKLFGKDILRINQNKKTNSYWINRAQKNVTFKDQF